MAISATAALWFLPFVLPICLYVAFTDMKQMRITNQAVLVLTAIFVLLWRQGETRLSRHIGPRNTGRSILSPPEGPKP